MVVVVVAGMIMVGGIGIETYSSALKIFNMSSGNGCGQGPARSRNTLETQNSWSTSNLNYLHCNTLSNPGSEFGKSIDLFYLLLSTIC